MRDKFATMAAVFVPLAFIGGISQGSVGFAIAGAIFWAVIFLLVRSK